MIDIGVTQKPKASVACQSQFSSISKFPISVQTLINQQVRRSKHSKLNPLTEILQNVDLNNFEYSYQIKSQPELFEMFKKWIKVNEPYF